MRLLIDAGNSRLKWNLSEDKGTELLRPTGAIAWRDVDLAATLDNQWRDLCDVHSVWLSNVAGETLRQVLQDWLCRRWKLNVINTVRSEAALLGVANGYHDPAQLGVDRWLALLACHALLPQQDACIIDCGSAITVDVLDGAGNHFGGLILPGSLLMLESLLARTQVRTSDPLSGAAMRLPTLFPAQDQPAAWLGHSTTECITLGIAHSGLGFLEHMIHLVRDTVGKHTRFVITGGDAPQYLANTSLAQAMVHYPDLVLQGLLRVADAQA